jgi:hypothetical protein
VTDLQDFSRRPFTATDQPWTNSALRPDQYAPPAQSLLPENARFSQLLTFPETTEG